jgi:ATP-binding cassette, subfamily C, bacterial CydD
MLNGAGNSRNLVRWILSSLWPGYAGHLALTLLLAGTALLPPRFFQYFVSSLHGAAGNTLLAERLLLFGGAIALVAAILGYLNVLSQERLQLKIEKLLRVAATRQLLTKPLETFDGLSRGEFLMRLGADLSKVEGFVATSLPSHLRYAGTLVIAGWLFVSQSGALALVPLAVVALVAYLNFRGQRRLAPLFDELRGLHGSVYQDMLETFEGVRTIRTHGSSERHLEGFSRKMTQMGTKSLRVVGLAGLFDGANTLSYQLMIAACLAFAAWRVATGQMDFETALGFPFYLGFFYSSAESLAGAVGEWQRFGVDSARLAGFLPLTEKAEFDVSSADSKATSLSARGLRIGYDGRPLAGPLDLDVAVGTTTVVVGPSGCGKSTLLDVFAGLRSPLGGQLVSRDCAVVEQRACLWEGTIRENLLSGAEGTWDDARLWSVLEACGLGALVRGLGGLEAKVQDRGLNFSEGQRYRLSIARALLLPHSFLLLDEPFAALDRASISTVVQAINQGKERHGFVIVTHQIPDGLELDNVLNFA